MRGAACLPELDQVPVLLPDSAEFLLLERALPKMAELRPPERFVSRVLPSRGNGEKQADRPGLPKELREYVLLESPDLELPDRIRLRQVGCDPFVQPHRRRLDRVRRGRRSVCRLSGQRERRLRPALRVRPGLGHARRRPGNLRPRHPALQHDARAGRPGECLR